MEGWYVLKRSRQMFKKLSEMTLKEFIERRKGLVEGQLRFHKADDSDFDKGVEAELRHQLYDYTSLLEELDKEQNNDDVY